MRYRKLDANGDYTVETGDDFYVNSPAAVAQAVQTRLRLFAGEWFLDTSAGMPWNTGVLGKYTAAAYDPLIKEQILAAQGVTEITAYTSTRDPSARTLNVAVTIGTIYGTTSLTTDTAI